MPVARTQSTPARIRLANTPADYTRLGLDSTAIAPFEDGLRSDPARAGSYEWWYFDATLDNGAKLVVGFYTKNPAAPKAGLAPFVTINLDLPDGRSLDKTFATTPALFSAASERCDVTIGKNTFAGDLHTYRIQATIDNVSVDVTLTGTVPAWRPETGHEMFEKAGEEKTFAWFVAVPVGHAEVEYTVDGELTTASGIGYHDHNWGDAPMMKLMHDWYWGRAQVGPYSLIAAHITGEKSYDYQSFTTLLLARDGVVVAEDGTKVTVRTARVVTDTITGKPVADVLSYDYRNGSEHFEISFERAETILRTKFINVVPRFTRILARLARFDAAYLRFAGTIVLRHYVDGVLVEEYTQSTGLWELMYLGKTRPPAV
ncbi:hydroxyneurosporene dehydrogenase [Cryobacterium sp. CG_9.6]|uniref:hydroxyneurosporene dehydrogenase n=1 Tax=Cryobacterium sp. CG_9.6 TaxID=2760710 RepID=UPI00247418D3|nr:hydroxyneurosporene dehydrogenase [Cryobacterium sp. CG_9.6]MDH6236678.1 putative secreted hydrolase [Cryobacterium sp. CG_9.6]